MPKARTFRLKNIEVKIKGVIKQRTICSIPDIQRGLKVIGISANFTTIKKYIIEMEKEGTIKSFTMGKRNIYKL